MNQPNLHYKEYEIRSKKQNFLIHHVFPSYSVCLPIHILTKTSKDIIAQDIRSLLSVTP